MTDAFDALLSPQSIAVVGASNDERKPGGVLVRNIVSGGYSGDVYPINPKGGVIAGLPAYRSIAAVQRPIDLAFMVLRRDFVLDAVKQCAAAGVKAVVIITAGFGEADEWGIEAEAQIRRTLQDHEMIGLGPNTIGIVSLGGQLRGTFVNFESWDDGGVALVAQSGIFAGAVADELMATATQRIGIHSSIGLGNRVNVNESRLVEALSEDSGVSVIGMYLESFTNLDDFCETMAKVTRKTPVVLVKGARTEQGRLAALAHTASDNPQDIEYGLDARLADAGVVRAEDDDEMVAILRGLSYSGPPAGNRLGIVTFSGGLGVMSSDIASDLGLDLVEYSADAQQSFADLLPDWQRPRNPADLWPAIDLSARDAMIGSLEIALADDAIDQVLGILLAVQNAEFDNMQRELLDLRTRYAKPLHLVIKGSLRAAWTKLFDAAQIPIYCSERVALRAMAAMTRIASIQGQSSATSQEDHP